MRNNDILGLQWSDINMVRGVCWMHQDKVKGGNAVQAIEIAKRMSYGQRVETVLKAAVAAGTTSADFTPLVEPRMETSEFIDLLRSAS